jgi:hypothetical protein
MAETQHRGWEMTLQSIFQLRQVIDRKAQPSLAHELDQLDRHLTETILAETPYELVDRPQLELFRARAQRYREPLPLRPAKTYSRGYLYRIGGLKATISPLKWNSQRRKQSEADLDDYFKQVQRDSGKIYLPFDALKINGIVRGSDRGFTWWSEEELSPPEIIRNAFRRGMPIDYLKPYSLVLRCALDRVGKDITVWVPSVLHGYDSPVFCPVVESKEPTRGRALDLSNNGTIGCGAPEYVMGPISTSLLEFAPVALGDDIASNRELSLRNPQFIAKLSTFFSDFAQQFGVIGVV